MGQLQVLCLQVKFENLRYLRHLQTVTVTAQQICRVKNEMKKYVKHTHALTLTHFRMYY